MKRFLIGLFSCFLALTVGAVPAEKRRMVVSIFGRGNIEVTFLGDEHGVYYVTDEGFLVFPVPGSDCFRLSDRTLSDVLQTEQRNMRSSAYKETGLPVAIPRNGTPKVPVILVAFADEEFKIPDSEMPVKDFYDLYCNGTRNGVNYTGAGSYGAVRDYFIAQSDSLLQLDFQVVGPIKLPHDVAYYGRDSIYADGHQEIDVNRMEFLNDVVAEVRKTNTEWEVFDNNGDGKVDMAFLIYAGLGQANGGESQTLWPREIVSEFQVEGLTFSVMAYCNQLRPMKTQNGVEHRTDGIGIMCHELSHALGLPDFYNQQHLSFGMDYWSVMDYGYLAKNGYAPCGYNAYERDFMGWRRLQVLDRPQTVRLYALEDGGTGYKIVNEANPNEYYVVHNLQAVGWDTMLATLGHGMLVTHVDYDSVVWLRNQVNADTLHQRMTIIPANNSLKGNFNSETAAELLASLAGNPYPGSTGNRMLTDTSVPASVVYKGGFMGKPITQIAENNQVVSFKFMALGRLERLDGNELIYDMHEKELRWSAVPYATCYALEFIQNETDDKNIIWTEDSIKALNFSLEAFPETTGLSVRIKAMADQYEDSEYSEWVCLDPTGIENPIKDEQQSLVSIYSFQGICLFQQVVLSDVMDRLPQGVYIVRGNKMTKKICVQH